MDLPVRPPSPPPHPNYARIRRVCSPCSLARWRVPHDADARFGLGGTCGAGGRDSYFMIYLWTKEYDDQTGFETYVFLKLNEILSDGERQHKRAPDVSWFPNSEAMAIPDLRAANNDLILSSRLDALSASAQVLLPLSQYVDPRALPAARTLRASMCARSCAKMASGHG